MSAFREYWIVVRDNDCGSDRNFAAASGGTYQRYFSENNARHAAEALAKQYSDNTYVVLKATGACQSSSVVWLQPAPF